MLVIQVLLTSCMLINKKIINFPIAIGLAGMLVIQVLLTSCMLINILSNSKKTDRDVGHQKDQ